ncbi:MAG: tetratricopeptide repeat protein, partial [candidate division Zixibacteria bacterium]|nr:tetratricopeptide repeat protein [candidate division Zixibacteria bacterium]
SDREIFELHLLECDYCFDKAESFQQEIKIISADSEAIDTFDKAVTEKLKNLDGSQIDNNQLPIKSKRWIKLTPVMATAAIILLFLILKPWNFDFHPTKEAEALENKLAVLYFENIGDQGDPDKLGQIVSNLLITDLSESRHIQIVSGQRLHDILKLLGQENVKSIDRDVASQVANKARAKWMLQGSIIENDSSLTITSQVVDTKTGNILSGQRVDGQVGESVFDLADKLSLIIQGALDLPLDIQNKSNKLLSDITTQSQDAYRCYLEGIENYYKLYNIDAIKNFRCALQHDSTFAMAYYYLAELENRDNIKLALKYIDKTSRIDSLYILIFDAMLIGNYEEIKVLLNKIVNQYPDEKKAYFLMGSIENGLNNFDKAILSFKKAVAIDPLYKMAYNEMVYIYAKLKDFENALWAIDKYIEIAPNEANPYDTKGDLYTSIGMLENAINMYKKSLSLKPDFYASLLKLGHMFLYKRDYRQAVEIYDSLYETGDEVYQFRALFFQAITLQLQGKFLQTINEFHKILEPYNSDNYRDISYPVDIHRISAFTYQTMGKIELALEEFDKYIRIRRFHVHEDAIIERHFYIQLLAENDQISKAEEILVDLKNDIIKNNYPMCSYYYGAGALEFAKENYDSAAVCFKKTEDIYSIKPVFPFAFMYAKSLTMAGRYDEAIEEFEKLLNIYDIDWRLYIGNWSNEIHYYLGMAYENIGQYKEAVKHYNIFLDILKNADTDIELLIDAKKRLSKISSQV